MIRRGSNERRPKHASNMLDVHTQNWLKQYCCRFGCCFVYEMYQLIISV